MCLGWVFSLPRCQGLAEQGMGHARGKAAVEMPKLNGEQAVFRRRVQGQGKDLGEGRTVVQDSRRTRVLSLSS